MRLSKVKKYIFYLTALMPFIILLLVAVFYSFNNQVLDMNNFNLLDELLLNFITICDGFTPNFVDLGDIVYSLFYPENIWGECLVSYFIYFCAVVIYNVLINIILFFVYIFESWVNKLEKDF